METKNLLVCMLVCNDGAYLKTGSDGLVFKVSSTPQITIKTFSSDLPKKAKRLQSDRNLVYFLLDEAAPVAEQVQHHEAGSLTGIYYHGN